jgi:hypothetical protein
VSAHFDRRDLLLFGGSLLAAGSLSSAWSGASGRRTRQVVLIVAGGVRTRDTFGTPGNVPVLHSMARQGVLYPRVRCSDLGHCGATLALFTGNGAARGLRASGCGPDPTLFEYVRQGAGLEASDVWISASGPQPANYSWSLHPDYGPGFGASLAESADDAGALRAAQELLAAERPRLTAVVLRQADVAHRSYAAYVEAIRQSDAAIGALWSAVRADPALRDTTSVIVLPELGRDRRLNSRGGLDHGDGSDDRNYVAAVCWGPDFGRGRVVPEDVRAIDVCPTVGGLLGAATPQAPGRCLPRLWA